MNLFELFLLAVGLSMDSFAASVSIGADARRPAMRYMLKAAILLAVFQGGMPVAGWWAGAHFKTLIENTDHWIAFGVLVFLGGKMIRDNLPRRANRETESPSREGRDKAGHWGTRALICIALATSLDALAVGISLALLDIRIVRAATIIAGVTLLFSLAGMGIGVRFGRRCDRWAALAGGLILVGIGVKILVEHLFFS